MTYKEVTDLKWVDENPKDKSGGMRTFVIEEGGGCWLLDINFRCMCSQNTNKKIKNCRPT